ncbi:MAG TPA: GSCFA domain-containing protein [Ilumatobacteraceae bacterium]|nr:GSCFA domain-containing protein [Ilumatobacteraceae bacterium]
MVDDTAPTHPYAANADYQRWHRGVTWVPPGALDPMVNPRIRVTEQDRVATIGSCFAQHLSRHLMRSGLNYYVAETAPPELSPTDSADRQYGVYSARYGNVYTVAQAEQLIARAFGNFAPVDHCWTHPSGGYADPFRPTVEPNGFSSVDALEADRNSHLAAVRTMFEQSDILVFTLGLTEAWRSRLDGAVYPTAPGVNAGTYQPDVHEFVNFDIDQVRAGLIRFCEAVRAINPRVRVLLTVSPVPLVATYEPRHVLVSTTYSKSVLRVAAQAALDQLPYVDYFPSYEIISTASTSRNYYRDDLREVTDMGVAHAMRCFTHHFIHARPWSASIDAAPAIAAGAGDSGADVICDEATIAAAIEASR